MANAFPLSCWSEYTDDDIARLVLVKTMKPLDLSLDTAQTMLAARDRLAGGEASPGEVEADIEALAGYLATATERLERLQFQLQGAEDALRLLEREIEKYGGRVGAQRRR